MADKQHHVVLRCRPYDTLPSRHPSRPGTSQPSEASPAPCLGMRPSRADRWFRRSNRRALIVLADTSVSSLPTICASEGTVRHSARAMADAVWETFQWPPKGRVSAGNRSRPGHLGIRTSTSSVVNERVGEQRRDDGLSTLTALAASERELTLTVDPASMLPTRAAWHVSP